MAANILPYLIVFAILFIVLLGLLTWMVGLFYKARKCTYYPNIWCADNWTCNTSQCTNTPEGVPVNQCFHKVGPTGLASCLYGANSQAGQYCFTPPSAPGATGPFCSGSTGPTGATGPCICPQNVDQSDVSCCCTTAMNAAQNCFNGCPLSLTNPLAKGQSAVPCCCSDPNNPRCSGSGACATRSSS